MDVARRDLDVARAAAEVAVELHLNHLADVSVCHGLEGTEGDQVQQLLCLLTGQAFDLVQYYLAFGMSSHNINQVIASYPFDINAGHSAPFDLFGCDDFQLVLTVGVKQPDRTVAGTDGDEVLECCDAIRNSLLNLDIAMEPISHLVKLPKVPESLAARLLNNAVLRRLPLQVVGRWSDELAGFLDHFLSNHLEASFVSVDFFKDVVFGIVPVGDIR